MMQKKGFQRAVALGLVVAAVLQMVSVAFTGQKKK